MFKANNRSIFWGAGLLLALLATGFLFSYANTRRLRESEIWVSHTQEVLDVSEKILRRLVELESGVRGFLITDDEQFLIDALEIEQNLQHQAEEIRLLTADNPSQIRRIEELRPLYMQLRTTLKELTELRREDFEKARTLFASKKHERELRALRNLLEEFQKEERELLSVRQERDNRSYLIAMSFIFGNSIAGLTGLGVFYTYVYRNFQERQRSTRAYQKLSEDLSKSNGELEQFAYVASHDLQEPLRAISGCVQILKKRYQGKLDASADELIRHTVEGAERMQTLINDLLAYSRVTTQGKELSLIESSEPVQRALESLSSAIAETQAEIQVGPLPAVQADTTQLTRLFLNLISNAIKFCKETPRIEVGAQKREKDWCFFVRDNGIGIDPTYFDRIFIIFQRLHNRAEFPGTGMGLAICRKIVERHGGQIWVESAPQKGSTFYFTVPDKGAKTS
ncbi:CHASE3 domain-containing protein [Telmatocola sphagniphila]|uniref:histidine kinase n=1 Tax=Telmatocola sphagniphila TaxID=1123043 RepID=A0A8E6EXL5_9BACT|nr:sensor histidine kinase [Telmatocola sphagniphila]QVL31406.1 CHASE3 domain-containing protein [Telmatocola sphagniphila]